MSLPNHVWTCVDGSMSLRVVMLGALSVVFFVLLSSLAQVLGGPTTDDTGTEEKNRQ